ncbi:MAG: hypothetical protein F9K25_16275 [Candidatus Contendobacter sp.]|nr:MAG: hypothetical protein F9K25_16275 [Candidatus Contendobacter sp.]
MDDDLASSRRCVGLNGRQPCTLNQCRLANHFEAGEFLKLSGLGGPKVCWSQIPVVAPKMATVRKTPDGCCFTAFARE